MKKNNFNLFVLGDEQTGKTSLIKSLVEKKFPKEYLATQSTSPYRIPVIIKSEKCLLNIWDNPGQTRLKSLINDSIMKIANGCAIVYDVSNESSFNNIDKWLNFAKEQLPENTYYFLIGNKIDLKKEKKILKEKGQEKAKEIKAAFLEISATKNYEIQKIIEFLAEETRNLIKLKEEEEEEEQEEEQDKEQDFGIPKTFTVPERDLKNDKKKIKDFKYNDKKQIKKGKESTNQKYCDCNII